MKSKYSLSNKGIVRAMFFAVGAFLASGIGIASAATLQISPVGVTFKPEQRAQALLVFNNGQSDVEAQVRIMHWAQEGGQDRLTPADDLVASPAIMKIEPGKRQMVRLIRLNPAASSKELSYRVILDQLPKKVEANNHDKVTLLMRYSLPVFVQPQNVPAKKGSSNTVAATDLSTLHSTVVRLSDGKAGLQMNNQSSQSLRISNLTLKDVQGRDRVIADGLVGYVLAGDQVTWPLGVAYPLPQGAVLNARFNKDVRVQDVPISGATH